MCLSFKAKSKLKSQLGHWLAVCLGESEFTSLSLSFHKFKKMG